MLLMILLLLCVYKSSSLHRAVSFLKVKDKSILSNYQSLPFPLESPSRYLWSLKCSNDFRNDFHIHVAYEPFKGSISVTSPERQVRSMLAAGLLFIGLSALPISAHADESSKKAKAFEL